MLERYRPTSLEDPLSSKVPARDDLQPQARAPGMVKPALQPADGRSWAYLDVQRQARPVVLVDVTLTIASRSTLVAEASRALNRSNQARPGRACRHRPRTGHPSNSEVGPAEPAAGRFARRRKSRQLLPVRRRFCAPAELPVDSRRRILQGRSPHSGTGMPLVSG